MGIGTSSTTTRSGMDPNVVPNPREGSKVDPGPWEGTVVGHIKGSRVGGLKVYIPELAGAEDSEASSGTFNVFYASPFYGQTYFTDDQQTGGTDWTNAGQSYGMWMVPPDIGFRVLVTFVRGNTSRGFWFACTFNTPSHHMVPGLARNIGGSDPTHSPLDSTAPSWLQSDVGTNSYTPVVEGYTGNPEAWNPDGIVNNPRFVHQAQHSILLNQGLDRDPIRGAISSSSMRESPSTVFGISTPGRPAVSANVSAISSTAANSSPISSDEVVIGRFGGHTFVMDDGATNADNVTDGTDQLIRLRTAGGHQLLMNDTEQILYIASASGYQWMEFSNDGSINVYSGGGINVRTPGVLNLQGDAAILMNSSIIEMHADKGIALTTNGSFSVSAEIGASIVGTGMATLSAGGICSIGSGGITNVGSAGITNISGSLTNLTGAPGVGGGIAMPAKTVSLPDVQQNGQLWEFNPNASLNTICSRAPAHEPWIDPSTGQRPAPQFPPGGSSFGGIATSLVVNMAASAGAGSATMAVNNWFTG